VLLEVGGHAIRATFDQKQFEEERISAVQYIRFPLGAELAEAFRHAENEVALRVDHPNYDHRQVIEGASRESLAADLAAE
jgi:hypothetical protein